MNAVKVIAKRETPNIRKGQEYYLIPEVVDYNLNGKLAMRVTVKVIPESKNFICCIYDNKELQELFEETN